MGRVGGMEGVKGGREGVKVGRRKGGRDKVDRRTDKVSLLYSDLQSLVTQLEHVQGDTGLESELVEEMQNVIGQFKVREAQEQELREQLGENQRLLEEKETDISEREEQLRQAQDEMETLRSEIQTLSSTVESHMQESQVSQERYVELKQQLERIQRDATGARQECDVLREANRDLQLLREKLETNISRLEGQNRTSAREFTGQLQAKDDEIRELEDMRSRVAVKEEIEERLVSEREVLAKRLSKAEHELADLHSVVQSMEEERSVASVSEASRDGEVESELQEQVRVCTGICQRKLER